MAIWGRADGLTLLTAPLRGGEELRRRFPVAAGMLTDHVPGAPPVLSTPALVAILEDTAADILRARFAPGAASVGTWIGVHHRAPALAGEEVEVHARVAEVHGRRVTFDVVARVGDRTIGAGQVSQTLVAVPAG